MNNQPAPEINTALKTLTDLPNELILPIISEFNLSDRTSFSATCLRFYKLEQEAGDATVKEERDELWVIARNQGRPLGISMKTRSNIAPRLRSISTIDPPKACILLRRIFRTTAFKERVIVRIDYNNADHHPIVDTLSCGPRCSNDVQLRLYHEPSSGPIVQVSGLLRAISSGFRVVLLQRIRIHPSQILCLYQGIIDAHPESLTWILPEATMNAIAEHVMGVESPDSTTTTRPDGNASFLCSVSVYRSRESWPHLILYHGGMQSTLWLVDEPYLCMERSNSDEPEGKSQYIKLPYSAPT